MVAAVPAQICKLLPRLSSPRRRSLRFPSTPDPRPFSPHPISSFPSPTSVFSAPLFSYSYELLFLQALSFDNHPHCPGVWGVGLCLGSHESPHHHAQVTSFHTLAASLSLFALFFRPPSFVFNSFGTLFAKHPGGGVCAPAPCPQLRRLYPPGPKMIPSPSTFVLRTLESILYPQSYCSWVLLPDTLLLRPGGFSLNGSERRNTQRFQMRLPLTVRWTTGAAVGENRIPRRQLPRRLFFPRQGCEGRLARRNPSDPAQRNYAGGTSARALPRARPAHRAPQRRRDWRGSGNRALRIPARRRRKAVAPPAFFWQNPVLPARFSVAVPGDWQAFSRFWLACLFKFLAR